MTEPDSGSIQFHTVSSQEQARLLTDPKIKEFFKPFLARERSASSVAEQLGCNLSTLLYRIKTFLEAGLLQVSREEKRAGRAIKHYRSSHDAYFIPFSLTRYATLEERLKVMAEPILESLIQGLGNVLKRDDSAGEYIYIGDNDAVWTTYYQLPRYPPLVLPPDMDWFYSDCQLRLSPESAKFLSMQLQKVFKQALEFDAQHQKQQGSKTYYMQLGLLPLDKRR